jgi:accessory colonization factor AcfC
MTSLTPLQIDDNTIIYIEASEAVDVPTISSNEQGLVTYGDTSAHAEKIKENFDRLKSTLTHYTLSTIDTFKKANNTDIANIDKVTSQVKQVFLISPKAQPKAISKLQLNALSQKSRLNTL